MITLYHRFDCPFCWKVRLAMHAHDIAYREVLQGHGETHPDVARLNPKGSIPVMVQGDLVITESTVILEYLNDAYLGGALLPGDARGRAEIRSLVAYSDGVAGRGVKDVVFEKRSKPEKQWDAGLLQKAEAQWRAMLDDLEQRAGQGYGFGETPVMSDFALLARFGLADLYGIAVDKRHPRLQAWYQRMSATGYFRDTRPAVVRID